MTHRMKADRNGFRRNLTLDLPITDANVAAVSLHKEPKKEKKNPRVKKKCLNNVLSTSDIIKKR